MSNIFAASEVVEIGIQIEKNGRDFYNTLKERSKNQKAAEIFSYLAGEEAVASNSAAASGTQRPLRRHAAKSIVDVCFVIHPISITPLPWQKSVALRRRNSSTLLTNCLAAEWTT